MVYLAHTTMHPIKASLLALLLFVLVLSLHLRFVEPGLVSAIGLTTSYPVTASSGTSFLTLFRGILLGDDAIINYSNAIFQNIGPSANYTFSLEVLYNTTGAGNVVQLNKNAAITLIGLGTPGPGDLQVMAGDAVAELLTGEFVQLLLGTDVGQTLSVLPGSEYLVVRHPLTPLVQ